MIISDNAVLNKNLKSNQIYSVIFLDCSNSIYSKIYFEANTMCVNYYGYAIE